MAETEASAPQRLAELRAEIAEHNRRYYEEDAPVISDRDYDILYRELLDLEEALELRQPRKDVVHPPLPLNAADATWPRIAAFRRYTEPRSR